MIIDDLQILITADGSGVESVLKKSLQTVTGTVNQINAQEVDWTTIFTRSVSPAIISGVASMFAFAISNAVNFQAALLTAGTAAGETSGQIAGIGQAALGLSTGVPASAQDLANAMLQLSAIFPNVNDQQRVAAAMAELSASGFGDLNDIVAAATEIFKQFGVETGDQAVQVLTDLMHAAEGAKESIPQLTQQFTPFSNELPGVNKTVDTFNGLISAFASEVRNLGAAGAAAIFQALGASSNNAVGPMELLGQSFSAIQKSLMEDGGLSAIQKTSETLLKMGPSASLIATNFGLSAQQVGQFQSNAAKLPQVVQDAKDIATNTQTIGQAYDQSDNALRRLTESWNALKALSIDFAKTNLDGWNALVTILDVVSGKISNSLQPSFNSFIQSLQGMAKKTGDALEPLGNFLLTQMNFNPKINELSAALTSAQVVNGQFQKSPLNSNQVLAIEQQAQGANLIPQLLDALTKGISGNNPSYNNIKQTFNLSGLTGQDLTGAAFSKMLYNAYQGY